MISVQATGDFKKTERFLKKVKKMDFYTELNRFGERGVEALRNATPKQTGKTAGSWYYEVEKSNDSASIHWLNSNVNDNVNIAVIIQYGHGTGWGGYVQGIDYINPAIRPVFDEIVEELWKAVVES